MSGIKSDCLFVIIPELYNPDKGYELCTIWPGIQGTHGTDFFCGYDLDLAIEYANELNAAKGHIPEFATKVLESVSGLDKVHFYNA